MPCCQFGIYILPSLLNDTQFLLYPLAALLCHPFLEAGMGWCMCAPFPCPFVILWMGGLTCSLPPPPSYSIIAFPLPSHPHPTHHSLPASPPFPYPFPHSPCLPTYHTQFGTPPYPTTHFPTFYPTVPSTHHPAMILLVPCWPVPLPCLPAPSGWMDGTATSAVPEATPFGEGGCQLLFEDACYCLEFTCAQDTPLYPTGGPAFCGRGHTCVCLPAPQCLPSCSFASPPFHHPHPQFCLPQECPSLVSSPLPSPSSLPWDIAPPHPAPCLPATLPGPCAFPTPTCTYTLYYACLLCGLTALYFT